MFESGRPVLLVPFVHKAPLSLTRVLVAWDGGRTAARACADALPFLTQAELVEVVTVDERREKPDTPIGTGIAETLLSYAADAGADLLVMGGYGRSRLREFVLGGATRGILEAMTLPVLMAH